MSEPINWQELTPEQRDRIVAEKIMGWHWVQANLWDVSTVRRQEWLLPPDVHDLRDVGPGEWTYYDDIPSEPYYIEHARLVPTNWIPRYTTSLDAAWSIVERITRPSTSIEEAERAANTRFMLWFEDATLWAMRREQVCEEICVEALRATGEQVIA